MNVSELKYCNQETTARRVLKIKKKKTNIVTFGAPGYNTDLILNIGQNDPITVSRSITLQGLKTLQYIFHSNTHKSISETVRIH